MSLQSQSLAVPTSPNKAATNHIMPIQRGQRYYGVVDFGTAAGGMAPVRALIDSGNDITIITYDTAKGLGFSPEHEGEVFYVKGIHGPGQQFKKFKNVIRIGKITPMVIRMGMAVTPAALGENLIGRLDVFDSGRLEIIYDEDSIEFREKHSVIHVAGQQPNEYGPLGFEERKVNYARNYRPLRDATPIQRLQRGKYGYYSYV